MAPSTTSNNSSNSPKVTKKVVSLSELSSSDRDVEIEVEIISHNLKNRQLRRTKTNCLGLLELTLG